MQAHKPQHRRTIRRITNRCRPVAFTASRTRQTPTHALLCRSIGAKSGSWEASAESSVSHPHSFRRRCDQTTGSRTGRRACEADGVESMSLRSCLEDLRQHTVVVVDPQQREITRVPAARPLSFISQASTRLAEYASWARASSVFAEPQLASARWTVRQGSRVRAAT